MARKKRLTNDQFMKDLMSHSPRGALSHAFIFEAIDRYCKEVITAGPEAIKHSMIDGHAWVHIAEDIKKRLDDHLRG